MGQYPEKLESGEIDMICQAQRTPEREERFLLSKYWAGTEACVLYARMDDDRYYYNDFEAFNGIRVAGLKESFQNDDLKEYAKKKDFSFELKEYMTTEECFQALEEGAVDAVVQGSLVGMDDYKIICRFGAQPFYLMAGKQKQKVMEDADYALGEITADYPTFLSELYQKYYGDTSADCSKCIVSVGRIGSKWMESICKELNIPTKSNRVDIGVRVELPAVIFSHLTDELYESKIVYRTEKFEDNVRTFCMNPHGIVVNENTNGIVTVNGHSYEDPAQQTENTNFALLVAKHFSEPFKDSNGYGESIARLSNMLGGGVIVQSFR